ncbi:hypothetical protein SAMN05216349_10783 [Oribacterium sp. KHPX15]|nr:hypothetical protein [Oribacterium sp. KHPX15]SEA24057.1 hypothetical protein SAMN05216349_10783 [Oribacterium sp. KHPX15]
MRDSMNRPENFSPYGGELILETVKGATSGNLNPENGVMMYTVLIKNE